MAPTKLVRLNQYNWLGQKFLAQHRYEDILKLGENLSLSNLSDVHIGEDRDRELANRTLSDHLSYITGLALMKTSNNHLQELIFTLQRLSFQKNSQYFLLLCQCLVYLGNHDSVVAICKQMLNKEIGAVSVSYQSADEADGVSAAQDGSQDVAHDSKAAATESQSGSAQQLWCLEQICEESIEFRKIFENVNKNCLINDPRLWFIFALSLEHQLQFKDADLAHRVACKLASGQARQIMKQKTDYDSQQSIGTSVGASGSNNYLQDTNFSIGISNYYLPHTSFSEFCIRHRADYRTAMQILGQASSNCSHFKKALEMITSLDNHSNSLRNPSFVYNQLALKCKQKLQHHYNQIGEVKHYDHLQRVCDEKQTDLEYNLIKSHILVNSIVQDSAHKSMLYKWSEAKRASSNEMDQIFAQLDKLIESMRNVETSCWSSHSLWNNLGVCYLLKRRYIASLSCLMKAHQINPLDWRINYNLALVYLHVGTAVRALCCSLASQTLRSDLKVINKMSDNNKTARLVARDQMLSTMVAISYSELGLTSEARRFYAELVAQNKTIKIPVLTIVNYLLLLQQAPYDSDYPESGDDREQDLKSSLRLLDILEQAWLQRSPNDVQFASIPLDIALRIGEILQRSRPHMKKNYAWTKIDH